MKQFTCSRVSICLAVWHNERGSFRILLVGVMDMNDRAARLHAHQRNIDRYERLLKSDLSAIELRFVEQRLSEERLAWQMLEFFGPSNSSKEEDRPARSTSA